MKKAAKSFFIANVVILVLAIGVMLLCFKNAAFSSVFCGFVAVILRIALSLLTGLLPFSLAEFVVVAVLPAAVVFLIVCIIRALFFKSGRAKNALCFTLGAVCLGVSVFILSFGVCYSQKTLSDKMSLEKEKITKERLLEISQVLKDKLYEYDGFLTDKRGASQNPHSWTELNKLIDVGYERMKKDYPGAVSSAFGNAKKIKLSNFLTYTHISGMYFPLTAEANVNTNYPDFVVAFSTAHEKAHQRGIAGEDEANFAAFLSCIYSEDKYLEYCAYISMYDYFLSAVLSEDYDEYVRLLDESSKGTIQEFRAYSEFFKKYRNSKASKVANNVNDTYLKTLGKGDGTKSYGLVVELMCAYFEQNGLDVRK